MLNNIKKQFHNKPLMKSYTCIFVFILSLPGIAISQENTNQNSAVSENLKNDLAVVFGEKSSQRQAADKEFAAWQMQLNQFLLNSNNDFAQAMTLTRMISSISNAEMLATIHDNKDHADALNDISFQPIADSVNQLIGKPDLSVEALDLLTSACFYDTMKDHCHANVLLEKRMQKDTANLQVYLRPFEAATKANNSKSKAQLIRLMAASQYSHSRIGLTNSMINLIEEFISNNPIPQSAIDSTIDDYQKLSGLSDDIKAQLAELVPAYMPAHVKNSYQYLNDLPPYKPVLTYCQRQIAAVTYCQDIAQTLINSSNSMIDQGIGHAILIATYELERNSAGVGAANQLNDRFRKTYECISDLVSGPYFMDQRFDPEFQKIIETSDDEFEMMVQHAKLRYRNLKANDNLTAVNPDSCFADEK